MRTCPARRHGIASTATAAPAFFERLGALIHTGPTHANINDFRALLITPP